jgi:antitoxin VapB
MAAVLNIKDAETHALAAQLAQAEGKTLAQVVKEALREKLDRTVDKRGGLADRIMALAEECSKLPVLDSRTPDEIMGYDEFGVPR